jgi:hypothetical protein
MQSIKEGFADPLRGFSEACYEEPKILIVTNGTIADAMIELATSA